MGMLTDIGAECVVKDVKKILTKAKKKYKVSKPSMEALCFVQDEIEKLEKEIKSGWY